MRSTYYCTKHKRNHYYDSEIGKECLRFKKKEKKELAKDIVSQAWAKAKQKYPKKDIHVTKSGRIYINYSTKSETHGGSAKAYKVGRQWIPKSQAFEKKSYKHNELFVSEWFYDKIKGESQPQNELISAMESLAKSRPKVKENTKRLRNPDPFGSPIQEKYIIQDKEEVKKDIDYIKNLRASISPENIEKSVERYTEQITKKQKEIDESIATGTEGGKRYAKQETKELERMKLGLK